MFWFQFVWNQNLFPCQQSLALSWLWLNDVILTPDELFSDERTRGCSVFYFWTSTWKLNLLLWILSYVVRNSQVENVFDKPDFQRSKPHSFISRYQTVNEINISPPPSADTPPRPDRLRPLNFPPTFEKWSLTKEEVETETLILAFMRKHELFKQEISL